MVKKAVIKIDKQKAKERVKAIWPILKKTYPDAKCTLDYTTPLELLIATIMAAQCTDVRVNKVTKNIFKKYRNAEDWANTDITELEQDIRETGFYKNKATNIKKCCQKIISDYKGNVPDNMDELLTLNGVGRKTANVILGNVFGKPSVICDTHAIRLSRRLGLSANTDKPEKLEYDLMEIVPKKNRTLFCHLLVFHGRNICKAPKPKCPECPIAKFCPAANNPKLW